jgi:hypothetical protein
MGTKNNPGRFDCYANAEPDEPMFVLLGRDPAAPILVRLWVALRAELGTDAEKLDEAEACAEALEVYLRRHGKGEALDAAKGGFVKALRELGANL